jgi:O-methyltransferase
MDVSRNQLDERARCWPRRDMLSIVTKLMRVASDPERLRKALIRRLASSMPDMELYTVLKVLKSFGAGWIRLRLGRVDGRPNYQIGYVPDRFYLNYDKYRTTRGFSYSEESEAAFIFGRSDNNAGDLARFYFLALVCDLVDKENLPGDVAELGVYKGNSAFLLAELARRRGGRTAYLFDTFESLPERDLVGVDSDLKDRELNFVDTSLGAVKNTVFALVHLDCDLYAPMRAGLEFFYPKLVPGGFMIIHDYSSLNWDGVEKAVDEFFADKPERLVPIPDKSGTIVVRKA